MTATKQYAVTLRHPNQQYAVTVNLYARDTTDARDQAAASHPGLVFVSVVLQEIEPPAPDPNLIKLLSTDGTQITP